MEQSIVTVLFLPLALGIIMLGMGMTLSVDDFKVTFKYPKAVFLGLTNQLLFLPLLGFIIVLLFPMKPELAVGIILISLCPGGPTSNIVSHLAKADLALSISLTAITSVVTNFTLPVLLNIAIFHFMGNTESLHLPFFKTILQIFVVTILPISIGMYIRKQFPGFTTRVLGLINIISAVFFVSILLLAILKERAHLVPYLQQSGLAAFLLNVSAMVLGYLTGRMASLRLKQGIAISIETGIQNGTLAITIALSPYMLNNTEIAIPAAIYSLIMFITSSAVVLISRKVQKTGTAPAINKLPRTA